MDEKTKDIQETKEKGKDIKKIVIPVIAIIIIIAIGIGLFIYINGKEENENKVSDNQVSNQDNQGLSLIDFNNTDNVEISNNVKKNNSEKLKEEKTYEGMKITDINLEASNGSTTITANVENVTESDFTGRSIVIVFTNEDGTEYARLQGYIPDILKGKSTVLNASTTSDISNAYDFYIE